MLPRAARLRHQSDFLAVTRRGRRAGAGALVVHMFASASDLPARAGVVVSRAVGGSVTRNQVKRRLRALLADRLDALPRGSALVVRALPDAGPASSRELAADLDAALRRARR